MTSLLLWRMLHQLSGKLHQGQCRERGTLWWAPPAPTSPWPRQVWLKGCFPLQTVTQPKMQHNSGDPKTVPETLWSKESQGRRHLYCLLCFGKHSQSFNAFYHMHYGFNSQLLSKFILNVRTSGSISLLLTKQGLKLRCKSLRRCIYSCCIPYRSLIINIK